MNKREVNSIIEHNFFEENLSEKNILELKKCEELIIQDLALFIDMITNFYNKNVSMDSLLIFDRIEKIISKEVFDNLLNLDFFENFDRFPVDNSLFNDLKNRNKLDLLGEVIRNNTIDMSSLMNQELLENENNFNLIYNEMNICNFVFLERISFRPNNYSEVFLNKIKEIIIKDENLSHDEKEKIITNFLCNQYIDRDKVNAIFADKIDNENLENILFSTLYFGNNDLVLNLLKDNDIWNKYKFEVVKNLYANSLSSKNKCIHPYNNYTRPQISGEEQDFLLNEILKKEFHFSLEEYSEIFSGITVFKSLDDFKKLYYKMKSDNISYKNIPFEKYVINYKEDIIEFLYSKNYDFTKDFRYMEFVNTKNPAIFNSLSKILLNESQLSDVVFEKAKNKNISEELVVNYLSKVNPEYSKNSINIVDLLLSLNKVGIKNRKIISESLREIIDANQNLKINNTIIDYLFKDDLIILISSEKINILNNPEISENIKNKLISFEREDLISLLEKKQISDFLIINNTTEEKVIKRL